MNDTWISVHIFYSADQRDLLVECIAPLLKLLKRESLVRRHFFIRYWENGPHVRLRLLPWDGAQGPAIRDIMEKALGEFFSKRPLFFNTGEPQGVQDQWRKLFIMEYGEDAFNEKYGDGKLIPRMADYSCSYIDYVPEIERYGGPHGMEVSEGHFCQSSDLVLEALSHKNMHHKGVQIGCAVNFTLGLCFAFLETEAEVADFMHSYANWWNQSFTGDAADVAKTTGQSDNLTLDARNCNRVRSIAARLKDETESTEWMRHARELRGKLLCLLGEGKLNVRARLSHDVPSLSSLDPLKYLLASYIHMHNNRLGVSVREEVLIGALIYRSVTEGQASA